MNRHQRAAIRYGLASSVVAFLGGLAVTMIVLPESPFDQNPRWQGMLFLYLGSHFVEISTVHTGGIGVESFQPLSLVESPRYIHAVPVAAAAAAGTYTCYQTRSRRLKHNVSNGVAAGMGYFLVTLLAVFVSDARPSISFIIAAVLFLAGSLWIGSVFVGKVGQSLPFIGIASLGLVLSLGLFLFMGGLAILVALWGVFVVSFGATTAVGLAVGVERDFKSRGKRQTGSLPRLKGLQLWLEDNWLEVIAVVIVLVLLYVGLSNQGTIPTQA